MVQSRGGDVQVGGRPRRHVLPWLLLLSGFVLFAVLSFACRVLSDQAEDRLLQERADELSALLSISVGQVRAPLDTAANGARVTDGDPDFFVSSLEGRVGDEAGTTFSAAALYRIGSSEELAAIGDPLELPADGPNSIATLVHTAATEPFIVIDLLSNERRLGYAVVDDPDDPAFVVYGERTLRTDPNVRTRTDEPFAQIDYAIYLGPEAQPDKLIGASVRELPLTGRTASATTNFGNQKLLLVITPIGLLSSWLLANLWWMVAVLGIAVSVAAAQLTQRLLARRDEALALAGDNARLYDEQRHIAETLQLGLLPAAVEAPPGAEVATRYWPAGTASLIGGDFYDAFQVDEHRWGVVIGDVCGKGVEAAAITGLARHTVRASARNTDSPAQVLRDVHLALRSHRPSTFCTVCFFFVTNGANGEQTVTIALGGHPAPLLRRAGGGVEEVGVPGTLLGIIEPTLTEVTFEVGPGDTIVLYTDGLTDAPPEQAVPFDELVDHIQTEGEQPIELLADSIRSLKRRRRPHGSHDDTALLVIRFGDIGGSLHERQLSGAVTSQR
jgi:serine phosphatase RsbU (regulator of sigma subunit)